MNRAPAAGAPTADPAPTRTVAARAVPAAVPRRARPARRPWRRVSGPAPARNGAAARGAATAPSPRPAAATLPARLLAAPFARAARARAAGVLDALLAGRAWIAVVGALLVGIVFVNVDLLQRGRAVARSAERAAELGRANVRLRAELGRLASTERIQREAAQLGLVYPEAGDVSYVRLRPHADGRLAARAVAEPADAPAEAASAQQLVAAPAATSDALGVAPTAAPPSGLAAPIGTPAAGTGATASGTGATGTGAPAAGATGATATAGAGATGASATSAPSTAPPLATAAPPG